MARSQSHSHVWTQRMMGNIALYPRKMTTANRFCPPRLWRLSQCGSCLHLQPRLPPPYPPPPDCIQPRGCFCSLHVQTWPFVHSPALETVYLLILILGGILTVLPAKQPPSWGTPFAKGLFQPGSFILPVSSWRVEENLISVSSCCHHLCMHLFLHCPPRQWWP